MRLLKAFAGLLFRMYFRFQATGFRDCPSGPLIVAANHTSFLDPFLLQVTFRRRIVFMVTASFYDLRRFRWFLRLMGCIRVQEGVANRHAIDEALSVLEQGGVIGIFPEGAISRDGRLKPAQPGAAAMVLRAQAPLVPAYIKGVFEAFPRTAWFPKPHRVEVRYGAPMRFEGAAPGMSRKERTRLLTREIMQALAHLGQVAAPQVDQVALQDR